MARDIHDIWSNYDETDEMDENILISDWIHGLGCL